MPENETKKHGTVEKLGLNDQDRQRCEIWTRVMGYHRPVSPFNISKKGEYYERRFFSEDISTDSHS